MQIPKQITQYDNPNSDYLRHTPILPITEIDDGIKNGWIETIELFAYVGNIETSVRIDNPQVWWLDARHEFMESLTNQGSFVPGYYINSGETTIIGWVPFK